MSFTIEFDPARFDLGLCVSSGQTFRWREVSGVWTGVDGVNFYRCEPKTKDRWHVESNASPEDFVSLFRLDFDDQSMIHEFAQRGPELAQHLVNLRGLRVMKFSGTTEVVFSFLCSANNHISRISQMLQRLAERGTEIETGFFEFPPARVIGEITEETLRSEGFGYRAATIPRVAQQIEVESIRALSYEAARDKLIELPGVGAKLADCICLFGYHHLESVPLDTHLWSVMQREYFPEWREKALTDHRYRTASSFFRERFGDYAGWAQQILFYDQLLNWRTRKPHKVPARAD